MDRTSQCDTCVFRMWKGSPYRCNYAYLTGHTRGGEDPEKCTHYIHGKKLSSPDETEAFLARRAKKAEKQKKAERERPKYDWDRAAELYRAGAKDGEIAGAIGSSVTAVFHWRKRNGMPANAEAGWKQNRRPQNGTERNGTAAGKDKEERTMKNETRERIRAMMRQDLDCRKSDLDRALLQGEEGKRQLEQYRAALLALDDFEESEKGGTTE